MVIIERATDLWNPTLGNHYNIWHPEVKGTPWNICSPKYPLKPAHASSTPISPRPRTCGHVRSPTVQNWSNPNSHYTKMNHSRSTNQTPGGTTYSVFNLVVKSEKLTEIQKNSIRLWILLINKMSEAINAETIASFLSVRDNFGSNGSDEDSARAMKLALELHALGLGGTESESEEDEEDLAALAPPKKSQNTTEVITVPSSEHVAEIVGKQGCKIKLLRQKTNTYIKTPGRGDNPQFVITGRWDDVQIAAAEIREAAHHFTQLRAERSRIGALQSPLAPSEGEPGTVTVKVRVPYKVVGLVVGPKGTTIKRIQQTTHTYIVTPSREKDPVFEVTGLPENVEVAKQEIESHIAQRTGSASTLIDRDLDFAANGTDVLENGEEDTIIEPSKNQKTRAMEALQTLSKLTPAERVKLQAALQSLNNNSSYLSGRLKKNTGPLPSAPRVLGNPTLNILNPLASQLTPSVTPFTPSATPFEPLGSKISDNFDVTNSLKYPSQPETPLATGSDLKRPSSGFFASSGNLMTSHVQPEVIVPEEHSEDAQIVVDLKKLGVDLDKDVGRSIQKSQEENTEVGVSKEAASWTPTQMKPRAIGQKPISKPAVNMAPNFGKPVGRKTPPNVQKIEAGDGIYIQTKHKQTTLRSSRDQQNFPSIPTHANNTKNVNEGIPNINPIVAQTIFQRNQNSPVPSIADDIRSLGTVESGYNSVETSTTFSDNSSAYSGSSSTSPRVCSICHVTPQCAALVPCGHSGFCYTCALTISAMQDARCPTCQTPVKMALNIR